MTNLAVRDQSGTADIWSRYVEFSGTYSGYLTYTLPGGLAASAITGVSVQVTIAVRLCRPRPGPSACATFG